MTTPLKAKAHNQQDKDAIPNGRWPRKGCALRKDEKDKDKPSLGASVIIIYYMGTLLKLTGT